MFEAFVTTPHYPALYDSDPSVNPGAVVLVPEQLAIILGRLTDIQGTQVVIPRNDSRTATVKVPWGDRALIEIAVQAFNPGDARGGPITYPEPFATYLHVTYFGIPVFWGPITSTDYDDSGADAKEPMVTISAKDTARLEQMFLRLGDAALNSTPDKKPSQGDIKMDYSGLRLLRDSATTRPNDLWRGWPWVGIVDGLANTASPLTYPVKRGDNVFTVWKDISGHEAGPEFDLKPLEVDNGNHYFAQLDCYDTPRGIDRTAQVFLQRRYGLDNLDGFKWTPGGTYVNSDIVTTQDGILRISGGQDKQLARTGAYMQWDSTSYGAHSKAVHDLLVEKAKQVISAYGKPPNLMTVTLKPDEVVDFRYLRDFDIGDVVTAGIQKDTVKAEFPAAINKVTLVQTDQTPRATTQLEVAPSVQETDIDLHVFP